MPAFVHHIATHTPGFAYSQDETRERMKAWSREKKTKRLIHAIYRRSGIETRHSVSGDFAEGAEAVLYRTDEDGAVASPGTAERNAVYAKESRTMAVEAGRKALDEGGIDRSAVTHVVFASCTGFVNPGPDFHLVRDLGLRESVERYTLGFMGCYAAFPALRMASQFCDADEHAVVLVVCLELCTLHMQITDEPDNILANSLFADGVAAAVVSAREPARGRPAFQFNGFASALLPCGEGDMAWEIGNEGFNIVLSSYVPEVIGTNIEVLLGNVLAERGLDLEAIEEWAVHPGGRSILDKVESSLRLSPTALDASRAVLRDYGNMSSATILFVLKAMLESAETGEASICAMAFGPGLTVETALLERIGGQAKFDPVSTGAAASIA